MNLAQKDKKFLGRDIPPMPIEITKAKGSYLYDTKGKKYIDFLGGWCVGNVGWDNKVVKEKVKKYDGPDYVSPRYIFKPRVQLAELLAKITPGKLVTSFPATGGTEAVETALQAAMSFTGRHKFISVEGSYHGHSIGAMSIGSSHWRKHYKNLLFHCHKIKPPLDKKAAAKVVKLLKNRDIAAYISEPVVCNLGVEIPTKEYFSIIQAACKKYGTVLIIDEVATGFGRTGKMFACEHYGLKPDIVTLAKAIAGGYGVLGAAVMTAPLAKAMTWDFSFYSTFGWHPRNVQAALANIQYLQKNKTKLLNNANELSDYFVKRLSKMPFKYPAELKIKGLAIGVHFKQNGYAEKVTMKCLNNGLVFSKLHATKFTFFPALTMSKQVAKQGLDILEKSL